MKHMKIVNQKSKYIQLTVKKNLINCSKLKKHMVKTNTHGQIQLV